MNKVKNIIRGVVWTVVGVWAALVVLLHIPEVQSRVAECAASVLAGKLGTTVSVGRVDVGWLDRIVIDDIKIDDRQGKEMLSVARAALKIDVFGLGGGRIEISSAQLFGMNGTFYKPDSLSAANYQFALDAFASSDTTTHKPLDVHVNSVVIRRGNMRYDRLDIEPTPGKFNLSHLDVRDLSVHVIMPYLTDDSVCVMLKKLSVKEASGIDLRNMAFSLKADRRRAELRDVSVAMPRTDVRIDSLVATYKFNGKDIDTASIRYAGRLAPSVITPADMAFADNTLSSLPHSINVSADITGSGSSASIANLRIDGNGGGLTVAADADIRRAAGAEKDSLQRITWRANIENLYVSGKEMDLITNHLAERNIQVPAVVGRLGYLRMTARGSGGGNNLTVKGNIDTGIGSMNIDATAKGENINAKLAVDNLNLGSLSGSGKLGMLSADISADGKRRDGRITGMTAETAVSRFEYNGYKYGDIGVNIAYDGATLSADAEIDDPNGEIEMYGQADITQSNGKYSIAGMRLSAAVNDLCPKEMKLTDRWKDAVFSCIIDADVKGGIAERGKSSTTARGSGRGGGRIGVNNLNGYVEIRDFTMAGEEKNCALQRLRIESKSTPEEQSLRANGDFGEADITGKYSYTTIAGSIKNIISGKLPALMPTNKRATYSNNLTGSIRITDASLVSGLLDIPLTLDEPLYVDIEMDDANNILNVRARGDDFAYDNTTYTGFTAGIANNTAGDTLAVGLEATRVTGNGKAMYLNLWARADGDMVNSNVCWDSGGEHPVKGTLNSSTAFRRNAKGGIGIDMAVHRSEILVNDTVWTVEPSQVSYENKTLVVDSFAVAHGNQYIKVTGRATGSAGDSLTADLRDVDIGYILDLVNFHKVEFDGKATGTAYVKKVFSRTPEAYADLTINDFLFQGGRMGTMDADVRWNNDGKQIEVDAICNDGPLSRMPIKGYVSIGNHYIDLNFLPTNTSLEFLLGFCGSFIGDINATATGDVTLSGDLSEINLTGTAIADGSMTISSLNTTYHMNNDTIVFIPNEILFDNAIIHDDYGNRGTVNGALHHKHLTKLTYDLSVEADNLLAYDTKDYGGESFYGTVYATGTCDITGRIGSIDFNINATAGPGSFIEYDAASEGTITEQEFITWRDKEELTALPSAPPPAANDAAGKGARQAPAPPDIASDMHINFLVNTTPDFTLRVLMDRQSGDCISLNGSGTINASYYNKGSFEMFGNYAVESGTYKLTIQNLLTREFIFDNGSSIVFGGNPYNASLGLKAVYTVSSVPLADLRIGDSFAGNNVRVDCIMNIGGTPLAPRVDFDIDLPTISGDAQQMVRALINSEEEMNQQVIYLLTIGRFYAESSHSDDDTKTSKTSLAMQSILSGTVSQQINNLLSSFVNASNWNVGANISTGDEGWNNAEYEGMLSGRLLNNRLLLNGQFGYRDNANATTSFIGDFDIQYLLTPNGNLAIKMYNQTNDRYFTKSSLNTQGIGLIMKKDFSTWRELFGKSKKKSKKSDEGAAGTPAATADSIHAADSIK